MSAALLASALAVVAAGQAVGAATVYSVTSGADSGAGSLRAAITQADADDVDAVIEITPELRIDITGPEIEFSPTTVARTLTINGNGAFVTRISGVGRFLSRGPVITSSQGAVSVDDLHLSGFGLTTNVATGGVLLAGGPVSLSKVSVANTTNTAVTAGTAGGAVKGGVLSTLGEVTISDSLIFDVSNQAENGTSSSGTVQGGVLSTDSAMTIVRSGIARVTNGAGEWVRGGVANAVQDFALTDSGIADVRNTVGAGLVNGGAVRGGVVLAEGGEYRMTRSVIERIQNSAGVGTTTGSLVQGGAVLAAGLQGLPVPATVIDSTVRQVLNLASSGTSPGGIEGGALHGNGGLSLTRSTVTGATGRATGAGAFVRGGGIYTGIRLRGTDFPVVLVNSTVTANGGLAEGTLVEASGGGIFTREPLTLVYSDVVGNVGATLTGAGPTPGPGSNVAGPGDVVVAAGTAPPLTTFGSVIADVGEGGTNCVNLGPVTSSGYNAADDTSCGLSHATDIQDPAFDPNLGSLADNGGPTPTLLPAPGSPLVDAIPGPSCQTAPLATGVITDQRGLARPSNGRCDIGAVEVQQAPDPAPGPIPPEPEAPGLPPSAPLAVVAPPRFTG